MNTLTESLLERARTWESEHAEVGALVGKDIRDAVARIAELERTASLNSDSQKDVIAQLEKDKARMDWLENPRLFTIAATVGGWVFKGSGDTIHIEGNQELRAAIDAAMLSK